MTKTELLNFAKFIFRSGEESYKHYKNILLDSEIQNYILDAFKDYQNSLKNKTNFVEPIELEEAQDVIESVKE